MASSSAKKVKQEYLSPASSTQENQPSPLALLAATCSKIGHPSEEISSNPGQETQQQGLIRIVGPQGQLLTSGGGPGEVFTTVQPFQPVGGVIQLPGAAGGSAAPQFQTVAQPQQVQAPLTLGLGGQVFQQAPAAATQLIATPVTGPGGTITYNLFQQPAPQVAAPPPAPQIQQYQTVTVQGQDGQEQTILVPVSVPPPQVQTQNLLQQTQTVITPQGQIIRTQTPQQLMTQQFGVGGAVNIGGVGQVGNIGGMINLGGGMQGFIRPQVQAMQLQPQVQTIQIPVSTPNGTVLQNIQIPVQGGVQPTIINNQGSNIISLMPQQQISVVPNQQQQVNTGQKVTATQPTTSKKATTPKQCKSSPTTDPTAQSNADDSQAYAAVVSNGYITIQPTQATNVPQPVAMVSMGSSSGSFQSNQSLPSTPTSNTTSTVSSLAQTIVSPSVHTSSLMNSPIIASGVQNQPGFQNLILSNGQVVQAVTQTPQVNAGFQILGQGGQIIQAAMPQNINKVQQQQLQLQNMQGTTIQNMAGTPGVQILNGAGIGATGTTLFGTPLQQGQTLQGMQGGGQLIISANGTAAVATPGPEQDIHINKEGALWQYDASDQSDIPISDISGGQSMLGLSTGEESPSTMVHPQYVMKRQRRIACRCPNCVDNQGSKENKKKVHICHKCEKTYGKTSHLRAHLRWHEGIKPFKCNSCIKSFTRSDELQRHMRTHTGDKRFQCQICEKKFMRSDHLKKHIKTHGPKRNVQTQAAITQVDPEEVIGQTNEMEESSEVLDDSQVSIEFKCLQGPGDDGLDDMDTGTTITIIDTESGQAIHQTINGKLTTPS